MFLVVSAQMKGEPIMTLLPLIDCSQMLAIDAKTLRHWRRLANIPLHPHPSDARVKCLTMEHMRQLAALHGRTLKPYEAAEPSLLGAPLVPTDTNGALGETSAIQPAPELLTKLAQLETQVATMQQHLAELALELLQERTLRYEQRLHTLETLMGAPQHPSVQPPAARQRMDEQNPPETGSHTQRRLPQTKLPAPSRLIPLIEYAADGTYVAICPERGALPLTPDSPEWFDWLATLSSFRFVGQRGRLSAYRKPGRTFCWFAYRRIHHHRYEHALGRTDQVTIDHLEHMAAQLQSSLVSL
jgi:hypothetical protein